MINFELGDLHYSYERIVVDTLLGLVNDYPAAGLSRVGLYEKAGDESLGNANEPGVIMLNARWFTRPLDELREAARERNYVYLQRGAYPVAWHGDMEEPHHILAHEYGHLLEDGTLGWREFITPHLEMSRRDPINCRPVSGYALVGDHEMFADTFAAMRLRINCEITRMLWEFLEGSRAVSA